MKKKGLRRFFTLDVHNHEGFTLVELIVVIAILAILGGVAVPIYGAYIEKANKASDEQLLAALNTAYAAACAAKGEDHINRDDVNDITIDKDNPILENYDFLEDTDIRSAFDLFYEGGEFKYYNKLRYDEILGIFSGSKSASTFDRPGVMAGIENTFNNISDVLKGYDELTAVDIRKAILGNFGGNLTDVLGLEDMLDGYLAATELEGKKLEDALEMYCPGYRDAENKDAWMDANGDAIARLKANLGVMHFANAANTDADVKGSVDAVLLAFANGEADETQQLEYYLSTPRGQQKLKDSGGNVDSPNVQKDFNNFITTKDSMYGMTGAQLAAWNQAIGDTKNEAGINTLGALYALSVGYYNSEYYEGDRTEFDFGSFVTVSDAIQEPGFVDYYMDLGGDDIAAYLEQMRNLSNSENMDLTSSNVFTGVFTGGNN